MKKRYILVALGVISGLLGSLFYSIVVSAPGGEYDPWMDLNDDGVIDAVDLQLLAWIYGALGTPINKTELLLELQARIDSLNATLLADYYTKTNCNSLFAVIAHLHPASDIVGGTLGVDQIRLGTMEGNHIIFFYEDGLPTGEYIYWWNDGDTFVVSDDIQIEGDIEGLSLLADMIRLGSAEGDHVIYFYEDGSPTGEYIYWQDSLDRFFVSDDIQIEGTITIPTTTRYLSISPTAWQPKDPDYVVYRDWHSLYTTTVGDTIWYAPVNLPHGAIVTELSAWVWDDMEGTPGVSDVQVQLNRQAGFSGQNLAAVSSSGSEGYHLLSTSSISYATIDNQNYAYNLYGRLWGGSGDHRLSYVRITYTVTETLP